MAKERADKPRKEKAGKAEKIVSKDKVKKHKKEKKPKHDDDIEMIDGDEPSQVEDSPTKSSESSVDATPVSATKSKKSKKEKKSKKAEVEEATTTTSFNDISLPLRLASNDTDDDGGAPLFAIDTNPTHVDLDSLATGGDAGEPKPERSGYHPPPSGLNRQARRRIRLIEEQRQKIKKSLGVPQGTDEKEEEVQAKLDEWISTLDDKTSVRMDKKRQRKERNAARLRNKRGKILTGERLKDRQKQLRKNEKKKMKKRGLSAANES